MVSFKRLSAVVLSLSSINVTGLTIGAKSYAIANPGRRELLQDLVTWDENSLFVRGERIMFYSGEFHPWRLPVPGLWLDIFQKIKALGYNGVSFYVNWALLEGSPGHFSADGVFAYEPFFDAAAEAGIYLFARPGPYINAEVSGGGYPGWLQRNPGTLRTNETAYMEATENYVANIGKIVAAAQITNGGPVVLLQAENEYGMVSLVITNGAAWIKFPDSTYIDAVNQQYRKAGVVVPLVNNEAAIIGLFTPDKPGGPDIYGHDSYPIGWDCANPESNWTPGKLPTDWRQLHLEQSPSTPYSIPEFQGGAIDSWGGPGLEGCAIMTNHEFERIFYKNTFSFGIKLFNIYMTYGGTNWGNLGQPGGYTSYDYGAAIREDRTIGREKYAEAKLLGHFLTSSPAYLEAVPGSATAGNASSSSSYVSTPDLTVTPIVGERTAFYVVRHTAYESRASTPYTLRVPVSGGGGGGSSSVVTIPQLGGTLTLNGRDAKVHVTDYDVGGGINLIYSTADIYTHGRSGARRVLLVYGLEGETHELAFPAALGKPTVEGGAAGGIRTVGSAVVVQWRVTQERKILHYGGKLDVYLLWRNDAFRYWRLELESPAPVGNYTAATKDAVIARGGYLLRTAAVSGTSLRLTGDLNATAELEVVAGLPPGTDRVYFNGARVPGVVKSADGRLTGTLTYAPAALRLPDLGALDWRVVDSLPEIRASYDDAAWTVADRAATNNTSYDETTFVQFALRTPTSLIAGDYGFHAGALLYRGAFAARGGERALYLSTAGGGGFGHSVWLGSTFLGSWAGSRAGARNHTLAFPPSLRLTRGRTYVFTVLIDHMGQETNWWPGHDLMKTPRGIIDYALDGHDDKRDITWKLTGNLGGERYGDLVRGPLNEGGTWAERQGYHLPAPPTRGWERASPIADGLDAAGLAFYATSFDLDIPSGYDVPLSFVFANTTTTTAANYRVQLFVNGWQFGEYINNLGPQTSFPVPEGILNHAGKNYLGLTLWAQDAAGAKLDGLSLVANAVIQSGMKKPSLTWNDKWVKREGAY
ncbi:putative glycoside hydrolase family 35 protein [Rosellinia necatrix]|uniref:Beta-galactosidase n=1 Tax=Rosellinia necatrix TaxID=77044 RepID=A0A1S8ABF1_ROSNE|nr:putative glycoside hydrolase family 35 protein [Rosellinia necatrix]